MNTVNEDGSARFSELLTPVSMGVIRTSGHYGVQVGKFCAVHTHTSLVPLEWHHVFPLGDGGPDVATNKIRVCANGHYLIHYLLDQYAKLGGNLPWTTTCHFNSNIRFYARKGYDQIVAAHANHAQGGE